MNFKIELQNLPSIFAAVFMAVLFLQSGLDKVFDRKGNLEWLTGHFASSPLAGMVPLMLSAITVMELVAGAAAVAGVVYYFATGSNAVIFVAGVAGAATILALFFGQRMAKDYAGAAVLVPYFLVMLAVMYLSR